MAQVKILLVDDQNIILEGLKVLVESELGFCVVGTASTGEEAVQLSSDLSPDIVLMDIRMPGIGGVEATRQIKALNSHISVLILTTFDDDHYIIDALSYGASGYLLKDIGREKLIDAIKEAIAGNLLITGKVAYKLVRTIKENKTSQETGKSKHYDFTERELEIIELMLKGFSNKEICETLYLSVGTVKNYMSTIYSKLGVNDRNKAILMLQNIV